MKRIRIVCKVPPEETSALVGRIPSLQDATVMLIRDDGTEEDISVAVRSIKWEAVAGEPAFATLEMFAEAVVEGGVV